MPAQASALKKNLGAQSATSTSAKDVDAPPPLGDSEVSAVQHSPGEVVKPEVGQRRENDSEIASTVAGKESGYVLDEDESSVPNKFIGASHELEEQAAALSCEAGALAGDGEVLAGEPSAEDIDGLDGFFDGERAMSSRVTIASDESNVGDESDAREPLREDTPSPRIDLGLEVDAEPGALESQVKAPYSREQRAHGEG